jgi:hypothetical protein
MILSDTFLWPLLLARRGGILQLQEGISAALLSGMVTHMQGGAISRFVYVLINLSSL